MDGTQMGVPGVELEEVLYADHTVGITERRRSAAGDRAQRGALWHATEPSEVRSKGDGRTGRISPV